MTKYSVDTVLAELARCIALFPNLHTVQLNFRFNLQEYPRVMDTFKAHQYSSVRNVFVSPVSVIFLCACPEVRMVAPMQSYNALWWPRHYFEKVLNGCPALEVLGPFYFENGDMKCKAYFLSSSPPNSSNSDLLFSRSEEAT